MKVLLVNTRHYHGDGVSTYNFGLADMLRADGHEVAFFAMQDERNQPDPNSDLFVNNVDFRELNRKKNLGTGLQVLARAIYSVDARRRFSLLLDRFPPDLVHLQNIHAHITPSVIIEARKRGIPVVWTLHDYKLICPNTHLLVDASGEICEACGRSSYYQPVLKRCKKGSLLASLMISLEAYVHRLMRVREQVDYFLTPSAFLRNKLIDRGFPADKVHHIPLFVSPQPSEPEGKVEDYLLFFGRVEPIKGIRPLLRACHLTPQVKLVMAGRIDEPMSSELPGLMPPNAEYVGLKQGEELHQLVRGARAGIVPSLWYENQPFSILEAFASGKPVIASDLGGMAELVGEEGRGILVPPGDVGELARAMLWVTEHAEEARAMGRKALDYVLTEHSRDAHYQRLLEVYRQVQRLPIPASMRR